MLRIDQWNYIDDIILECSYVCLYTYSYYVRPTSRDRWFSGGVFRRPVRNSLATDWRTRVESSSTSIDVGSSSSSSTMTEDESRVLCRSSRAIVPGNNLILFALVVGEPPHEWEPLAEPLFAKNKRIASIKKLCAAYRFSMPSEPPEVCKPRKNLSIKPCTFCVRRWKASTKARGPPLIDSAKGNKKHWPHNGQPCSYRMFGYTYVHMLRRIRVRNWSFIMHVWANKCNKCILAITFS